MSRPGVWPGAPPAGSPVGRATVTVTLGLADY